MCLQWQDDLTELAAQVLKDKDAIKGIVLASAKTTFFAGADLKGAMRLQGRRRRSASSPKSSAVKKNFRTLETLGKPVVSCSMARHWAAAGRWRWWATTALPSTTPRSSSACPKSRWACCPAPVA